MRIACKPLQHKVLSRKCRIHRHLLEMAVIESLPLRQFTHRLRINDEASLAEQRTRITELSNKLRIASATLDMERQLVATGKGIPELMAARQLHVIDVGDTDPNGNRSRAFGRLFLAEGKSLSFCAFDDEGRVATESVVSKSGS